MTGQKKVSAPRSPLKILAIFALAFTLQGMSLAVFQGDRPARETEQMGPASHWMGSQISVTETFTVTSIEDDGPGSLRQAILDANESPGLDEIRFAFAEPITITLGASLEITDPVSMEAHGPWITDTSPGWLTIDGKDVFGDVFIVLEAPGTSFRRIRVINADKGFGFVVTGDSEGSEFISNTVQSGMGGIKLEDTGHITVTHNALLDLLNTAVQASNSSRLWLGENRMRFGDSGIGLLDGVSQVAVISNTLSGSSLTGQSVGIFAAGVPAPTGVIIRDNWFTDTLPVEFGPGTNNGFPAPEIIDAHLPITATKSLDFSAWSPADPFSYTYPLSMDVYVVRDGSYLPLGVGVSYDESDFPDVINYTLHFTDPGVFKTDQLALIATTANPSSSEFSPPVAFTPRPPPDDDGDGVEDADDQCPGTVIPEATVPSVELRVNRFALVDDNLDFDTTLPEGSGPRRTYSTTETAGCSCEQVIDKLGLGRGHRNFGCSISAMDSWVASVSPASKQQADADEASEMTAPETFVLDQNYPNPFNPTTMIGFQVPEQGQVVFRVFDMLGRVVTTLVDSELERGSYQVRWDGRNAQGHQVVSGLYIYQIKSGDSSIEKTMSLLR